MNQVSDSKQKGFTLVELTISLMIIGTLIAGILKGEELLENSRSMKYVRQLNSYNAAVHTFRLSYDALPGDMTDPADRLPGCVATPCTTVGNGNGYIGNVEHVFPAQIIFSMIGPGRPEMRNFWVHMAKAGLITGVDPEYAGAFSNSIGVEAPQMPDRDVGVLPVRYEAAGYAWGDPIDDGNYYSLQMLDPQLFSLVPSRAFYIDQKMDDGLPGKGTVRAAGNWFNAVPRPTTCVTGTAYNTQAKLRGCNLLVRIP